LWRSQHPSAMLDLRIEHDLCRSRRCSLVRVAGLATYRQLRYLIRFGHKNPLNVSFEEASAFLDRYFGRRKRRFHPPATAACV
jgi:hypothetical protein